jgi:hypothetical protein
VARKTPDYTKQVRHERPRSQMAATGRRRASKGKRPPVPPPARGMAPSAFFAVGAGVLLYVWVGYLAFGGATTRSIAFGLGIAFCGLVANLLTGVLALYALYPERYPLPGVDKRLLTTLVIVFTVITVFFGVQIPWMAPGVIPPVGVFYFIIRPRLKLMAQVRGTYRPSRRDTALAEIQARREQRRREREEQQHEKERQAGIKAALRRRQGRG